MPLCALTTNHSCFCWTHRTVFLIYLSLMENFKLWLVISLWSCFQHNKPVCFLSFPSSSFPLAFLARWFTAAFSILSSLCDTLPSHCFSPHTLPTQESQLPFMLSNNYTNIQMQACTQALACTPRCVRTHIMFTGWYTYTKGMLDHLCDMSESLKKRGCVVITTALHPQWNLSGQVEGGSGLLVRQITPSCNCLYGWSGQIKSEWDKRSCCCRLTCAICSFRGGHTAVGDSTKRRNKAEGKPLLKRLSRCDTCLTIL